MKSKKISQSLREILDSEDRFRYMMLSRMQSDCEYYLGFGNRCKKHLWTGDEATQIKYMKAIYNSFRFRYRKKPKWITLKQIKNYEKQMKEV